MGSNREIVTAIVVVVLALSVQLIVCNYVRPYVRPDNCSSDQYFNIIKMVCESCVSHLPYTNKNLKLEIQFQTKSSDNTSCVCRPGFRPDLVQSVNGQLYCINNTIDCPPKYKPLNGFQCAKCWSDLYSNQTLTGDDTQEVCVCPKRHILVASVDNPNDTIVNLKCHMCHKHFTVTSDGQGCRPCHESYIRASGECDVCPPDGYVEEDGMCLPTQPNPPLIKKDNLMVISTIDLENTNTKYKSFTSDYFYRRIRPAHYNCKSESNRTACQLLANLCVLYHYSYFEDQSDDTNICKIFNKLSIDLDIYYKNYYRNELSQNNVDYHFKLNDRLEFIASRFAINGQLLDYSDLMPKELQLCFENEKSSESGFVFNHNFRQHCKRRARDLWDNYKSKNIFYELFLKNGINNGINLYPIPVLIRNLKRNSQPVNYDIDGYDTSEEAHQIKLTHRFYLIDSITGYQKSDDSKLDYNLVDKLMFIRIAKSIQIDIRLRKQDGTGVIYPPLITILYETLYKEDYDSNREVDLHFSINYSMDDSHHKRNQSIILSVFCCAAVLWAIFRTWVWAKRNGKIAIDIMTIVEFIVNTIAMISNVFFFVNIFFALKLFIIFKMQSVIDTMLSTESQENTLITYIIVGFVLKFIHLLHDLLVISSVDIFFIDWERPKKRDINSMVTMMSLKSAIISGDTQTEDKLTNEDQNKRRFSLSGGSLSSPSPKLISDKSLLEFPNVTVWRTNFVANEWMELCGYRRLSLTLHLLLIIIVLDYFQLANLSLSDPSNMLTRDESQRYIMSSRTGRLAIGALVYAILALINIGFKKFIYENLVNNKLLQFVDLCSVCNISVFAMQHKKFGYYIHGLAANGKSDVNMLEMYEQLEREENDLCSKRGLLPNTDQQTFEMCLPSAVDDHYRRVRSNLSGFAKISDRMRSFGSQLSKADTDKLIPTYLMINKFLTGFIEHNFKDVDYMVREKSTVESIFEMEFADTREKGFFYNDNGHSFEAILFYGLEFTLFCFEMMLFLVTDICSQNFTFSAILTFIVSKSIRRLYLHISRKNLIRKALLDKRFLI